MIYKYMLDFCLTDQHRALNTTLLYDAVSHPSPPSPGAIATTGTWPPHYLGFTITLRHTPKSVGLLWTGDQPDAETSTWQHTNSQETDICATGRIRTHDPNNRPAADPHLRPRGPWDRPAYIYMYIYTYIYVYIHIYKQWCYFTFANTFLLISVCSVILMHFHVSRALSILTALHLNPNRAVHIFLYLFRFSLTILQHPLLNAMQYKKMKRTAAVCHRLCSNSLLLYTHNTL
jgi:hypothetical protein